MSSPFEIGCHSEQGRRDYQQDAAGGECVEGALVAAVADGLGHYPGSDRAAQMAVRTVLHHAFLSPAALSLRAGMEAVVEEAHQEVLREQRSIGLRGLTTLALLKVEGTRAVVVHVGDSRVYRRRAGQLEQLTKDHKDSRHVLNRCLGNPRVGKNYTPDVLETDLQPGDVYLLSTDGVHESLSPAQLRAVLEDGASAQVAAEALVHSALASGSRDNCTAVVVRAPGAADALLRGAA
ncbi:serine/threonine-protein phosphatase [Corallococcus sp. ZKHCc1 1396]|uniref:Serine/threonine-protein phosphatase n=1 Tax=Corallococcus soli TaxID=2710757 RepID=A0ABR9PIQ5_9BACT|nr:protein phosphatase 2C domain-containing protein [Corallococcus soli]MBE4747729.1 serine/threonine-protein phosphatase [Corallococcus soli]